jgi:hypothetical protein
MELWEVIQSYKPSSGNDIVRAAKEDDLGWHVKKLPAADQEEIRKSMAVLTDKGVEALKDVPKFEWDKIFNFV